MKGFDDYGTTIQLYLDNELNGQHLEDFRAHLEECESCQMELEAEERLSALLHRSRPLYSAPDALRARVIQAVGALPSTSTPASTRLRTLVATVLTQLSQSASLHSFNWGALVAAILVVAAILPLVPTILRQSSADSYIEAAVAAHCSYLNGNLPLEIQSESPRAVTSWFAGKVPFNFRLPSATKESEHEQAYRLTGGRLVQYRGEYVALVAYQLQQQKISLLVTSSRSIVAAGGQEVASSGIVFHYRKQASFNVITWSNHGLTYALVSSMPGSGRQSCLVCHQNMGDGAHFTAHR
jgi:mycothiol system anti-sigma-R factor